jgi:hypothetical protein
VLFEQWETQEALDPEHEPVQVVGKDLNKVEAELRSRLRGAFRTTPPPPPRRC